MPTQDAFRQQPGMQSLQLEAALKPAQSTPRALFWASQATMCSSIVLFFFECYAYNMIFLRRIMPAVGKGAVVPLFRILFNAAWAMAVWSYHQAHWSDPGAVPEKWHHFVRNMGEALAIHPARPEWQPGQATLCKKCQAPRPERSHHCVLCGVCILRMDHHCPWINNCVGFHNHKYFLLLGIYTWLASLTFLGTSLPELIHFGGVLLLGWKDDNLDKTRAGHLAEWELICFLTAGVLAALVALLLMSLLSTHVPLALRNLTTIEDFYENMPNPFEQGSRMGNLAQVFGGWGADWFLPVKPWRPIGDGVCYEPVGGLDFSEADSPRTDGGVAPWGPTTRESTEAYSSLLRGGEEDYEKKWKARYKVLSAEELKAAKEDQKLNPFMAQFWACGRGLHGRSGGSRLRTSA